MGFSCLKIDNGTFPQFLLIPSVTTALHPFAPLRLVRPVAHFALHPQRCRTRRHARAFAARCASAARGAIPIIARAADSFAFVLACHLERTRAVFALSTGGDHVRVEQ